MMDKLHVLHNFNWWFPKLSLFLYMKIIQIQCSVFKTLSSPVAHWSFENIKTETVFKDMSEIYFPYYS